MSASPLRTLRNSDQADNHQQHTANKVALRQWTLDRVQPARVFDVFAGVDGEMHRRVWHQAADYVGCDQRWRGDDTRRRYVGDSATVLRCVDLRPWNVFDVDCYGQPWETMIVIAARRRWATDERGAVVCTESNMNTKLGAASHGLATLAGLDGRRIGKTNRTERQSLARLALARWAMISNVEIDGMRLALGNCTSEIQYFAITFRGLENSA